MISVTPSLLSTVDALGPAPRTAPSPEPLLPKPQAAPHPQGLRKVHTSAPTGEARASFAAKPRLFMRRQQPGEQNPCRPCVARRAEFYRNLHTGLFIEFVNNQRPIEEPVSLLWAAEPAFPFLSRARAWRERKPRGAGHVLATPATSPPRLGLPS